MLYGYCVWLKVTPYESAIPSELFIIDPNQLNIIPEGITPYIGRSLKARIRIGGKETNLKLSDLIIFNDVKTGFGNDYFLAQSRMTALGNESKLLQVLADAELSIIRNRGALGILSKDINDRSSKGDYEDDKEDIQEQYKRYGITSDQWNIIITSTALKWQSITQPLKDLMLPEFEEQTAKKICAVFDVPYELLPLSGQSTYANRKEAILELYQNYIIPTSNGDAELLTKSLCKGIGLTISMDYSDMYILQEHMLGRAETTNKAIEGLNRAKSEGNITIEEWRKLASDYIDIDPSAAVVSAKTMLAIQLGVGGLQALIAVITDQNMTDEQKRAILIGLFDRTPEEALEIIPLVTIPLNAIPNV